MAKKLKELFKVDSDITIVALASDTRKIIQNNTMFFCLIGANFDGHNFVKQAISKGASCIIHQRDLDSYDDGVVYLKVDDVYHELNRVSDLFYDSPSTKMNIVGVTGTNGKTTIAYTLKNLYSNFVYSGYIGTLGIASNDAIKECDNTTPETIAIHSILKDFYDEEIKAAFLEVSSQGLLLKRVDSIDFDIAIFTNLTHDHLDVHKTLQSYLEAKAKLFKNLKKSGIAILNKDDISYEYLDSITRAKIISYGIANKADIMAKNIILLPNSSEFDLIYQEKVYHIKTNLLAEFNIYNLLAIIAAMLNLGVTINEIIPLLNNIHGIDGRMEFINGGQPYNVIVDYAHTPDGFEKLFTYARKVTTGKLIVVFGSAGRRDKLKRKILGEIASKYCDNIILTAEDNRDEEVVDICKDIAEKITTKYEVIVSRLEAIEKAIEIANVNDTVLILGKGRELFMSGKLVDDPWIGDHQAAKEAIAKTYKG